jgi:Transposase
LTSPGVGGVLAAAGVEHDDQRVLHPAGQAGRDRRPTGGDRRLFTGTPSIEIATPERLELFEQSLAPTDRVVMETRGNALATARILEPHVAVLVLAHAKQVRAISHARIKTDTIDAKILADLLAADRITAAWVSDERCRMLGRLVSRRRGLVKRRTQIKNGISAVLHRNLKGRSPASDPFGTKGRAWIAEPVLVDEDVRRLITIPGGRVSKEGSAAARHVLARQSPTPAAQNPTKEAGPRPRRRRARCRAASARSTSVSTGASTDRRELWSWEPTPMGVVDRRLGRSRFSEPDTGAPC